MPPKLPIYMDYHATTPLDPRVLKAMLPYFGERFGNAASIDHAFGHDAQEAVERAREGIARNIGASDREEVIFTSGATESNNLAISGVVEGYAAKGNHVVSSAIEHPSVLDTLKYLASRGAEVTLVPVDPHGHVDPDDVRQAVTDRTVLISIMTANNEVGTIQPIREIGHMAKERGILFHTDATQAVGHTPVNVGEMNVDLMSFSAHKFCGPKGIGALYVRRLRPRVRLAPIIHGGGHERGMRSGTLNVPSIVGLARALEIAKKEMLPEAERFREWTGKMLDQFQGELEGVDLNGHPTQRLPHNLNVYVPGVESQAVIMALKDVVAISSGAACTTSKVEPSHVILAMGFPEERAYQSVRFGLGRFTTLNEVTQASTELVKVCRGLRSKFLALRV